MTSSSSCGRYNKLYAPGQANVFFFSARIPFVSVRPWTAPLGLLKYAMTKNPFLSLQALPFNIYGGSTTFGAYDTIGNDFSKVRRSACACLQR